MTAIREKRTRSGPLLEVDFYPIFENGRRLPERSPAVKPTSDAQRKYNRTQAVKKMIRLINANFDGSDCFLHPTYSPDRAPENEAAARRDMVNYLRRVRERRKKEAAHLRKRIRDLEKLPEGKTVRETLRADVIKLKKLESPFKYIYVIEKKTYKTGRNAGRTSYHFHLFLTGGLDPGTLEEMWKKGMRVNCGTYKPDRFGPEAAAKYMSKDPQGAKRFSYSKNLTKPKEKTRDGKITRGGLERIAKRRVDDRIYWETRHKGYRFLRCFARYNEFNGHWYLSAVLYRTDGDLPPWTEEDWIDAEFAE